MKLHRVISNVSFLNQDYVMVLFVRLPVKNNGNMEFCDLCLGAYLCSGSPFSQGTCMNEHIQGTGIWASENIDLPHSFC